MRKVEVSPDKRQFLSAWRNGEERETRLFDHSRGPACICHMDIVDSVMEFDQELNWLDRGRYDIGNHIILRSFDIELQHVNVLKLQIRQMDLYRITLQLTVIPAVSLEEKLPRV